MYHSQKPQLYARPLSTEEMVVNKTVMISGLMEFILWPGRQAWADTFPKYLIINYSKCCEGKAWGALGKASMRMLKSKGKLGVGRFWATGNSRGTVGGGGREAGFTWGAQSSWTNWKRAFQRQDLFRTHSCPSFGHDSSFRTCLARSLHCDKLHYLFPPFKKIEV